MLYLPLVLYEKSGKIPSQASVQSCSCPGLWLLPSPSSVSSPCALHAQSRNSPALLCFSCPVGSGSCLEDLTLARIWGCPWGPDSGRAGRCGEGAWRVSAGRVCGLATCFPSLPGEECNVFAFLGLWLQPHSCSGSQHGGGRRAVHAPWLHAFSSTSKVYLVCSLCHSWPHLVACRHAGGGVWPCLQMAFRVQTSCLWKGWS